MTGRYPFAAVSGQAQVKKALKIALVNGKAGGLIIGGRKGTAKSVLARSAAEIIPEKIVDLPLNITEDNLFGSIDLEHAINTGEVKFSPGILKRATGNVLYIDEINLLRQEILKDVLDANEAGMNLVEQSGLSLSHPVRFTILGTMNPKEGVLPAEILDRFGMYAVSAEETDPEKRMEIMRRCFDYEKDPAAFREKFSAETESLKDEIKKARMLLGETEISEAMLQLAAQMCLKAGCAGHRGDIYLAEAARAVAALAGRAYVLPKDLEEAALFVLPHRAVRQAEIRENPREEGPEDGSAGNDGTSEDEGQEEKENEGGCPEPEDAAGPSDEGKDNKGKSTAEGAAPEERTAPVDKTFPWPEIILDFPKDRNIRRGSGKRSITKTDLKQGRYVRAGFPKDRISDIAFDATFRAAAPMQKMREKGACALNIKTEDIRQKIREKRIGSTFLFAVDASGSMGAYERMSAVKGAIFSMLREAYEKRDRVGMIAFRKDGAEIILPVTRSIDLAEKCLKDLPTGGRTPLAEGLALSLDTLALLGKKEKAAEPVLVIVTDGRANAAENGADPVKSAVLMAEKIRRAKITSVVIDTEKEFLKLGVAKDVADAMGAAYYTLQSLSRENILRIVRSS